MTLTLQLPTELSEEIEQQAGRIGVSPEEHATDILSVAAAVVGDPPHSAALSGYRMQLAETMLRMIRLLLAEEPKSEADRARLLRMAALLGSWVPEEPAGAASRPSAFGKYRGMIGSSERYAEFKQGEIDREDGRSG